MYQVYVVVNKINDKMYIGSTERRLQIGWIAYFDTYKSQHGYNDTPGGDGGNTNGGKKFSEEWKAKMSKSLAVKPQTDRRRFSEEIKKEICRLYTEEEKSTYNLGKNYNCSRTTIDDLLKRNNISIRKSNYTGHSNSKNIFSIEQEIEICNKYLLGNVSRSELSRKFNCGKTTIRNILLKHNIKL
jgi:transposase-like protein